MTLKEFCKKYNLTEAQATGREEIGGDLYLGSLTSLPEGVSLSCGGYLYLRSLTSLPEGVSLSCGGYLYLGSLTSLPEGVSLSCGGDLNLGSLTSLPEGVSLSCGGYLNLGSLTSLPEGVSLSCGGDLYLGSLTSLPEGVSLSCGGYLYLRSRRIYRGDKFPKHVAQLRYLWRNKEYIKVDGIFTRIISERGKVMKVQRIARKEIEYLITDGEGRWAHGATLKEAKESLIYKITDRDSSKYKTWDKNTIVSHAEAIEAYRVITGACALGTRHFCESVLGENKKDKYTIAEVIELTKGQYGAETFKNFFTR